MDPYAPYPLNLVRDWLYRRRWWVRLALATVLVPWFGYFTYTRWTAQPAVNYSRRIWFFEFDPALSIPDPAVDCTAKMVAAINALPPSPLPSAPTTAPAGMEWIDVETLAALREGKPPPKWTQQSVASAFEFYAALDGEWTPKTRYVLGQIVTYLELPATQAAIDRIVALSDKPYCIAQSGLFGSPVLHRPRQVVRLLMARARYDLAERHDFDGAFRHLQASLNIAAGMEDDEAETCILSGAGLRIYILREASLWPTESQLTRTQIRQLQDLASRHRRDPVQQIQIAIRADRRLSQCDIDETYTKDARGTGWFVPVYRHPDLADHMPTRISNLFSPFFNNRRCAQDIADVVRTRITDLFRNPDTTETALAPWRETRQLPWTSTGKGEWRPALPSLRASPTLVTGHFFGWLRQSRAGVDGAITVMALSAYRNERGRYPASLSVLVPEYLAELPIDPFDRRLLRYRLDAKEGYLLYSVGADGRDDNGVRFTKDRHELDCVIDHDRSRAFVNEWYLVPVGGVTRGATDGR